jgi:ribulose kinase
MACVIGLDFGTDTVRAGVADAACRALGRRVEHGLNEIEARS